MKKICGLALAIVLLLTFSACTADESPSSSPSNVSVSLAPAPTEEPFESAEGKQIKLTAGDVEVTVTLNGSRAAADLVEMLPLELTLIERNSFAKGMTLPEHLFAGEPTTQEYEIGTFGYWDDGPDLAIFYDDIHEQTVVPIIPLGKEVSGAEAMADTSGTVRLELAGETASPSGEEAPSETDTADGTETSSILVAYFTVPETDGVDAVTNASRVIKDGKVVGNTEFVAGIIQETLGADLFAIETVQEYPGSHEPLLEFAYNEKAEYARPELASHIDNLDNYDVIFVGFPNWNADLPMPLYTFFDEYDFSGKIIVPFATHGGSGLSNTVRTIQDLEPGATVIENGLSVSRNSVADSENDVKSWVESLALG